MEGFRPPDPGCVAEVRIDVYPATFASVKTLPLPLLKKS